MSSPIQPLGGVRPALGEVARGAPREPERAKEPTDRDPAVRDGETAPEVSDKIEIDGRTAEFSYDKDIDRIVVKIYSSSSEPREVVREIPPEEYRAFAARFRELLGVLFDRKA